MGSLGNTIGVGLLAYPALRNISTHKNECRQLQLRCLSLLQELTKGIEYLHSKPVVHGDLKGVNVLVNAHDPVRICDFGFSPMIVEAEESIKTDWEVGGSKCYMAPELLPFQLNTPATTDVWATGWLTDLLLSDKTASQRIQRPAIKSLIISDHDTSRFQSPFGESLRKINNRETITLRQWYAKATSNATADGCRHGIPNISTFVSRIAIPDSVGSLGHSPWMFANTQECTNVPQFTVTEVLTPHSKPKEAHDLKSKFLLSCMIGIFAYLGLLGIKACTDLITIISQIQQDLHRVSSIPGLNPPQSPISLVGMYILVALVAFNAMMVVSELGLMIPNGRSMSKNIDSYFVSLLISDFFQAIGSVGFITWHLPSSRIIPQGRIYDNNWEPAPRSLVYYQAFFALTVLPLTFSRYLRLSDRIVPIVYVSWTVFSWLVGLPSLTHRALRLPPFSWTTTERFNRFQKRVFNAHLLKSLKRAVFTEQTRDCPSNPVEASSAFRFLGGTSSAARGSLCSLLENGSMWMGIVAISR